MTIHKPNISNLSLFHLQVFEELYRRRNVNAVARAVGRPQPTVSNILKQLRDRFDDPLFTRHKSGMQPSPKAETLRPFILGALDILSEGIESTIHFDAARHKHRFSLYMSDIAEALLFPHFLKQMRKKAPHIRFQMIRTNDHSVDRAMENREIDFMLGFLPNLRKNFEHLPLFSTDYVCIVGNKSKFWSDPLDRDGFLSSSHAVGVMEHTGHEQVLQQIERDVEYGNIYMQTLSFLALPDIVAGTDLIATVPRPLAVYSAREKDIKIHPAPIDLPNIEMAIYWRNSIGEDLAKNWLIEQFSTIFRRDGLYDLFGDDVTL